MPPDESYLNAKKQLDFDSALFVVSRCLQQLVVETIHSLSDRIRVDPIIVAPRAPKSLNALPRAYATYLADTLECEVDSEIFQTGTFVGRTSLDRWSRFVFQPTFDGTVLTGRYYILADDVITTGATLAQLASYICRNGGKILVSTVLARKHAGHLKLAITQATKNRLIDLYGLALTDYWKQTFSHLPDMLTESEGRTLIDHAVSELRNLPSSRRLTELEELLLETSKNPVILTKNNI